VALVVHEIRMGFMERSARADGNLLLAHDRVPTRKGDLPEGEQHDPAQDEHADEGALESLDSCPDFAADPGTEVPRGIAPQ
jgi:hypothetical protein